MKKLLFFLTLSLTGALADEILTIDSQASAVEFTALGRPGGFRIIGKTTADSLTGKLALGAKPGGEVTLKMDRFETGMSLRDQHLKDHLEVSKFPESKFQLQAIDLTQGTFLGLMTLHGETQKVLGKVLFENEGGIGKLGFQFEVQLPDFKIVQPSFAGVKVDNRIEVNVKLNGKLTSLAG